SIIDHWASESTWNLDIYSVSQDGRYIIVRHALVATETASLLTDAGHETVLVARTMLPGASVLGEHTASRLLQLHKPRHVAHLGRSPRVIRTHSDRITVGLDDGTQIDGDLAIVAHGTIPAAPSPWSGPDGIPVDTRLRTLAAPEQRIYAAGGLAIHHYPRHSSYRIDHWDDSAAQGVHAAHALLHDVGHGDDPGAYLPVATFSARVHGHTLTGAGHPALGTSTRVVSTEPLLVAHHLGDTLVALTGIDAVPLVHQYVSHLHESTLT
ncbi:FAD-dependent oxidoreductase, partial [Nesterenkonia sp. PF2B19]|uniref:FAD-dependent oxidoreductase n=1 Tax=Nesterenkonia sp. PF2B19 TaxID=1881858 RepID=UPI000A2259D4